MKKLSVLFSVLAVLGISLMFAGCSNDDGEQLFTDQWLEKEISYEDKGTLTAYCYYSSDGSYKGKALKDGVEIKKGLNVVLTSSTSIDGLGSLSNTKFAFKNFEEGEQAESEGKTNLVNPTAWNTLVAASVLLESKNKKMTTSSEPQCIKATDHTYTLITDVENQSWKKILALILIEKLL